MFAVDPATADAIRKAFQDHGEFAANVDDAGPLALLGPPITAVHQPVAAIGRSGVCALLDCLAGAPIPPEPVRLPVGPLERASVAMPAQRRRRTLCWTSDIGPHWLPEEFVRWPGCATLWRNALSWATGMA